MVYYKTVKDAYHFGVTFIENELLTKREIDKMITKDIADILIKTNLFEKIELSPHKTYKMFGCRFEITD